MQEHIHTVSELAQQARMLLEHHFSTLWVEGEISNLRMPTSGHIYFSLKDEYAQVRCALFKQRLGSNIPLEEGMHVAVLAYVSLYEERGDFQLIVQKIQERGEGALRRAFEALKKMLAEEGLFESRLKKRLPEWPMRIGVITSPTGAAIKDVLSVLKRRFSCAQVIIYPVQVQGAQASAQIVKAIQTANKRAEVDVIILCRGGGSLEDLWSFNEQIVARAIFASELPIVTGIGHETDFTIADFVADQRASTPSAAAEWVSPDIKQWIDSQQQLKRRLIQAWRHRLQNMHHQLSQLNLRLPHPLKRLHDQAQKLDLLSQRLHYAQQRLIHHQHIRLQRVQGHMQSTTLLHLHQLKAALIQCNYLENRLHRGMQAVLKQSAQCLSQSMQALDQVSPLGTLRRGYSILTRESGEIISHRDQVRYKDRLKAKLAQGEFWCEVM